jgi:hypothetical protein
LGSTRELPFTSFLATPSTHNFNLICICNNIHLFNSGCKFNFLVFHEELLNGATWKKERVLERRRELPSPTYMPAPTPQLQHPQRSHPTPLSSSPRPLSACPSKNACHHHSSQERHPRADHPPPQLVKRTLRRLHHHARSRPPLNSPEEDQPTDDMVPMEGDHGIGGVIGRSE